MSKEKTILVACSSPPTEGKGINTYSKELVGALRVLGLAIVYASPRPSNSDWLELNTQGFFNTDPNAKQTGQIKQLLNFIQKTNVAGIINNDNSLVQSIAPWVNCPFISVGHLDYFSIAPAACYNIDYIDYMVAISNDMQRNFVKKYKVPLIKCPIVHNGVVGPDEGYELINNRKGPINVVYGGAINKRKGGDLVIKMLLNTDYKWTNIRVKWFGRLSRDFQVKLADNESVSFHESVPRKKFLEELAAADIFLLASRAEGCPMAMLEAMSYGVVPIASNGIGAMRWLITHGKEGYICDLDNWGAQAIDCIQELDRDRRKLYKMKKASRDRYLKEFQIGDVARRMLELIDSPTVDRSKKPDLIQVLRWHRPPSLKGLRGIIDRVCWRLGILQKDGQVEIAEYY